MSRKAIPRRLRRWLESLGDLCEYCQASERVMGIVHDADHIIPHTKGGPTNQTNLCRACASCNTRKGDQVQALDPQTKQQTPLFNPRQQNWVEHFAWSEDSTEIIGLTACGRATVEALKMNNLRMVRARRLWASVGWHPLA